jgi:hypothetical protein
MCTITVVLCYSNPSIRHPDKYVTRARYDTSTSNLGAHVAACAGTRAEDQKDIKAFAQGSTYQKELLRVYVGLWAASSYRPFSIVEDPYFVRIVQMFHPDAAQGLPSDTTISRDVKEYYTIGKENVKQYLKVRYYLRVVYHH